jgi:PAS domain S-box-containing protein
MNITAEPHLSAVSPRDRATSPISVTAGCQQPRDLLKLQEAVVAIGRRAVAEAELSVLLRDAAGLLAEMLDGEHCGIAQRAADVGEIRLQIFPARSQAADPQGLVHRYPSSGSESLAAFAILAAHPVVTGNLAEESRFHDLFLERQGIRSGLVVPLTIKERGAGALAAYSRREQWFSEQDVPFAETIAHLVSVTMACKQLEEALQRERRANGEILQTIDAMVFTLDPEGRLLSMNRAARELTGFTLDDVCGRRMWEVFPVPEESDLFQKIFRRLRQGTASIEYESSLLAKDSTRRRIAWSYGAVRDPGGNLESVAATGIDVTLQRAAEEGLQRAEQAMPQVRQESAVAVSPDAETNWLCAAAASKQESASGQAAASNATEQASQESDRRRRPRRLYPFKQSLAPICEGRIPTARDFTDVQCHDISSGGFSFLSAVPPTSDSFVVILGQPPQLTHVTAQVAHVRRVTHDGRRMYLIGCNYTGRIT